MELEPFMPDGKTPRCQARSKRTGQQCRRAARKGYRVCAVHGAGTRKREATGERKPPGRPSIHGLYSKRGLKSIRELYDEVVALERDLDNTDRELAMLRAALWYLLERADSFEARAGELEELWKEIDGLRVSLREEGEANQRTVLLLGEALKALERALRESRYYLERLSDQAMRVIHAVKQRAETASKHAEAKALEHLLRFVDELKAVLLERLEPDEYEALMEDVRRRVLAQAGVRA